MMNRSTKIMKNFDCSLFVEGAGELEQGQGQGRGQAFCGLCLVQVGCNSICARNPPKKRVTQIVHNYICYAIHPHITNPHTHSRTTTHTRTPVHTPATHNDS